MASFRCESVEGVSVRLNATIDDGSISDEQLMDMAEKAARDTMTIECERRDK